MLTVAIITLVINTIAVVVSLVTNWQYASVMAFVLSVLVSYLFLNLVLINSLILSGKKNDRTEK